MYFGGGGGGGKYFLPVGSGTSGKGLGAVGTGYFFLPVGSGTSGRGAGAVGAGKYFLPVGSGTSGKGEGAVGAGYFFLPVGSGTSPPSSKLVVVGIRNVIPGVILLTPEFAFSRELADTPNFSASLYSSSPFLTVYVAISISYPEVCILFQ
jgi:hypothetical protein